MPQRPIGPAPMLVRKLTGNPVRFGKLANVTGPIPPNSLVIMVPGMFSTAETMRGLATYHKAKGHNVHILESPFNIKADSALASTDWLTHSIDRIRLNEASMHCSSLLQKLEQLSHEERVDFLCDEMKLKDDRLGKATAKAALGLMYTQKSDYREKTDLTRIIMHLRDTRERMGGTLPAETARKQLYSLTAIARNQLRRDLLPVFLKDADDLAAQNAALEKTIDHVLDQIAPRVVLVGHSMGGFVSMLTLFEQMNDTSLVVGLAAPGENGTNIIPSALGLLRRLPTNLQKRGRDLVGKFGPGLRHMQEGSPETEKLKADHQPFNTTIFAVGMPGEHDGLVGEQNFKMNDTLPGRINVMVTPKQANIIEIASPLLHSLHQVMGWNPLYKWASNFISTSSDFVKGVAYHCGLLQFPEKYWGQDGDILRGILEAPKTRDGKYDYEDGRPDYPEAVSQIRRLIAPNNYEGERLHFLNLLYDKLQDVKNEPFPEDYRMRQGYRALKPDLEAISQEKQPLQSGVADQAKAILDLLDEPKAPHGDSTTDEQFAAIA